MIWLLLLIPVISVIVIAKMFPHRLVWWELLLPTAICAILIGTVKEISRRAMESDTHYYGSVIVEARYYEPWSTWVHRICTRSYKCGKSTCTTTYDCSYCDNNPERWTAVDQDGKEYPITQRKYQELAAQWSSRPTFVDMNRSINHNFGCGKDGDMYRIVWDKHMSTGEAAVNARSYTNKIQSARSAFNYSRIDDKDKIRYSLYNYPDIFDQYRQQSILGLDSILKGSELNNAKRMFEFFNGYYGKRQHIKLFVLLFYNQPLKVAQEQEKYWMGGNDNEVVVCIGLNRSNRYIEWVKPFSWCRNKRILVDIREDIMNTGTFDAFKVYRAIHNSTIGKFDPRDLDKDFNYLSPETPTWVLVLIVILVIGATVGTCYYCINNQFTQ